MSSEFNTRHFSGYVVYDTRSDYFLSLNKSKDLQWVSNITDGYNILTESDYMINVSRFADIKVLLQSMRDYFSEYTLHQNGDNYQIVKVKGCCVDNVIIIDDILYDESFPLKDVL